MWLFGVTEPDCFGAVEVRTGTAYLFVPKLPQSYSVWMGPLLTLEDYGKKYRIPNVHYVDDVIHQKKVILNFSVIVVVFQLATVLEGIRPGTIFTLVSNFCSSFSSSSSSFKC